MVTRDLPLSSIVLWLANRFSQFSPYTRFFRLRRAVFVAAGARIHADAKISGAVRLHHPNVDIGDSWIGPGGQLLPTGEAAIVIGDRCAISPEVMLHCGSHDFGDSRRRAGKPIAAPITIGDGTWVGTRATFLSGAAVGSGCMVAAGSVVRGRFGDNLMIAGVPARTIRTFQD